MIKITKQSYNLGFDKGLSKLNKAAFYTPSRILGPNDSVFDDNVLTALLAYGSDSKQILDLGSYFGMLPFFVEDLVRAGNEQYLPTWTLVDNMLYVNELRASLENSSTLTGRFLPEHFLKEWYDLNERTVQLFEHTDTKILPPVTVDAFNAYWQKLATYYDVQKPNMSMHTSLYDVPQITYDLVSYDLSAGRYTENKPLLEHVILNHTHENTIIVLDDVWPKHPMTMALFYHIVSTFDYKPVAFSRHKVAIMKPTAKGAFLEKLSSRVNVHENRPNLSYYGFRKSTNEYWGDFLQLEGM